MSRVVGLEPRISAWSFVAAAMAEDLLARAENPNCKVEFQAGVYQDAVRFFQIILEAVGSNVPTDPARSVHLYTHATTALKAAGISADNERGERHELLRQYAAVVDQLKVGQRVVERTNPQLLRDMARFFQFIAAQGDREEHEWFYFGFGEDDDD